MFATTYIYCTHGVITVSFKSFLHTLNEFVNQNLKAKRSHWLKCAVEMENSGIVMEAYNLYQTLT